jgi:hypothetical protein
MGIEQALSGELSVKDSLLVIARTICETELGVSIPAETGRWITWVAGDHFPAPMSLDQVFTKPIHGEGLRVFNATFNLPDQDMSIMVDRAGSDLDDDPFAADILERFKLYPEHAHEVCLLALGQQVPAEQTLLVRLRHATTGEIVLG